MRATPRVASSVRLGDPGTASTLTRPSSASTSAPITRGSVTPGTKMQSAPASSRPVRARSPARAVSQARRRHRERRLSVRSGRVERRNRTPTVRIAAIFATNASIGSRGSSPASLRSSRFSPTAPTSSTPARGGGSVLGCVTVAGLHVGGHGQIDRRGDRLHGVQHRGAGDQLPVGVAKRVRGAGARRRDCLRARASDDDSTGGVPGVDEDQRPSRDVQSRGAPPPCPGAMGEARRPLTPASYEAAGLREARIETLWL